MRRRRLTLGTFNLASKALSRSGGVMDKTYLIDHSRTGDTSLCLSEIVSVVEASNKLLSTAKEQHIKALDSIGCQLDVLNFKYAADVLNTSNEALIYHGSMDRGDVGASLEVIECMLSHNTAALEAISTAPASGPICYLFVVSESSIEPPAHALRKLVQSAGSIDRSYTDDPKIYNVSTMIVSEPNRCSTCLVPMYGDDDAIIHSVGLRCGAELIEKELSSSGWTSLGDGSSWSEEDADVNKIAEAVIENEVPHHWIPTAHALWVPSWVKDAISAYRELDGYAGLSIVDYIRKMKPDGKD